MHCDICFPDNNEQGFIVMAKSLKIARLLFVYNSVMDISKARESLKKTDIGIFFGLAIDSDNDFGKSKNADILVSGLNRRNFVESRNIRLHHCFEAAEKKDSLHYRKSGMTQVEARILSGKNKIYGFSHSLLLNSKTKPIILGRMIQNVMLLQKYKCRVFIGSFAKDPYELRCRAELASFGASMGLSAKDAKESLLELGRNLINHSKQ